MSALRAYPTLLRVGFAEALAYRAELFVWLLTTTMPLVSLVLWTSVAAEAGPLGRFGEREFSAYFLTTLVVRQLTGSWLVWEMNEDIKSGALSQRLLKPVHPLVVYSARAAASLPLRALLCVPIVALLALGASGELLEKGALPLAGFLLSLASAWLINFFTMALIGTLAFYVESSTAVFSVYLSLFTLLSGYLVPLELLPPWAEALAHVLPFRYAVGFPVELVLGFLEPSRALFELGVSFLYAAALGLASVFAWGAGARRFSAYGG